MNKFSKKKKFLVLLFIFMVIATSTFVLDTFRLKHNKFVKAPDMNYSRIYHTATLLKDGRVLIVGGDNSSSLQISEMEIYYPSIKQFEIVTRLNIPRSNHTATLLKDGRVLIVGGKNGSDFLTSIEIYDPVKNTIVKINN
ncbi:MAG: kelch repeat-containing protein, partial [bacterium]